MLERMYTISANQQDCRRSPYTRKSRGGMKRGLTFSVHRISAFEGYHMNLTLRGHNVERCIDKATCIVCSLKL